MLPSQNGNVLQTLQDQRRDLDHKEERLEAERDVLRKERDALRKAREEDPERRALEDKMCEQAEEIDRLKGTLDFMTTMKQCTTEVLTGCPRCRERLFRLAYFDERYVSKLSRDPNFKALADVLRSHQL